MNILTIPLRNIKRKLLRTSVLVAVFAAGILSVVMLFYVSQQVGKSLEEKLSEFGANILIQPKSENLKISYGGFSMGDLSYDIKYLNDKEVSRQIKQIELSDRISTIAPKLIEMIQYNGISAAVIGVDWKAEERIKTYWNVSGKMPEQPNEAIIGNIAGQKLNLKIGDSIQVNDNYLIITGILDKTGADDDNIIFANLAYLQKITDKIDQVNFVEVSALCGACPIEDIVNQIFTALPNIEINAMQQIVKERMYTVNFVKKLVLGVSAIILTIACFMMALFMLTAVNERIKEIGILRSMGYSKLNIFSIFTFESVIIGIVSSAVGFVLGVYASGILLVQLGFDNVDRVAFNTEHFIFTLAAVTLLSILSSSFPAVKAARISPTEALIQL